MQLAEFQPAHMLASGMRCHPHNPARGISLAPRFTWQESALSDIQERKFRAANMEEKSVVDSDLHINIIVLPETRSCELVAT